MTVIQTPGDSLAEFFIFGEVNPEPFSFRTAIPEILSTPILVAEYLLPFRNSTWKLPA